MYLNMCLTFAAKAESDRLNWWIALTKSTRTWFNCTIQDVSMKGHVIGWKDEGVVLFTPYNEEMIYTDYRVRKQVIKQVGQSFCDNHFKFIKNWTSEKDIIDVKHQIKNNGRISKYDVINREYYLRNVQVINDCFNQSNKFHKIGGYEAMIYFSREAKKKIKELTVSIETINYKIQAYLISSKGYLEMNLFYKSIRSMRKGFILNQILLKHQYSNTWTSSDVNDNVLYMLSMQKICKRVNDCLNFFDLEYNLTENEMTYSHQLFGFRAHGYNVIKLSASKLLTTSNNTLLRLKLQKYRNKRCSYCKYIPSIGNKHRKCKCNKVYYCDKYCQKRGWYYHRSLCSEYKLY